MVNIMQYKKNVLESITQISSGKKDLLDKTDFSKSLKNVSTILYNHIIIERLLIIEKIYNCRRLG